MLDVKARIETNVKGAYVHSVQLGSTVAEDERAGFFGFVDAQLEAVCSTLSADENLAGGFHAVGFSQGGLLLRGLVQRCPSLRVHTLVTMGSPHGGVTEVPGCPASGDKALCTQMRRLLDAGAYSKWIRGAVVQAQYFRDAYNLHTYLQNSQFLADINNERDAKNMTYAKQISSLKKLVLFRFSNDTTVVPRDSAWFSFQDGDNLMPLRSTALYQMDWLGLYHLDRAGSVIMDEAPGVHMQFTLDWFEAKVIIPWLATPSAMDDALLLGPAQTQAATAYA